MRLALGVFARIVVWQEAAFAFQVAVNGSVLGTVDEFPRMGGGGGRNRDDGGSDGCADVDGCMHGTSACYPIIWTTNGNEAILMYSGEYYPYDPFSDAVDCRPHYSPFSYTMGEISNARVSPHLHFIPGDPPRIRPEAPTRPQTHSPALPVPFVVMP